MMTAVIKKDLYTHLAGLLAYPQEDLKIKVDECVKALVDYPQYSEEVAEELRKFQGDLEHMSLDDIQGLYSYTFELSSDHSLDLGYHLFEGFKRSSSLSAIKAMYRDKGFPIDEVSKGELPDHLPIVLQFLGFAPDDDLKKNFKETFVMLAVAKLNKNFERTPKNIYKHLIGAIYKVLDKDVKEVK